MNPTKERLHKGSEGRQWRVVDKTLRKRREKKKKRKGEEGRITIKGEGDVVQKGKTHKDNWKRTIQLVFEAIFL